ncbi:MAG TPA: transglutaminase family protein, partial [Kofleriaceae bacterium]|nr:transglutaminase family protein [Kofleriaceae bacterium]
MIDDLDSSLAMHDDLIARRGVEVWVAAEPTFSRADSVDPAWTTVVLGDDKLARAHAVATRFADLYPGASTARVAGPDDARFAFGVRWNHDGTGAATRTSLDDEPRPRPSDLDGDGWLTVTPDPGVLAIHMAPCATTTELVAQARRVWVAAANAGLSPIRYRDSGDIADSGGGGRLTLRGSTAATSPFIRYPHVLPALIRYVNNHPSLSYWFANECVGSASPGPRPDEGTRERVGELEVTLGWLEAEADRGELSPEMMWQALEPLLVD